MVSILSSGLTSVAGCYGVKIGDLPNLTNSVSGELILENEYNFCIRNFSYDGRGPGESTNNKYCMHLSERLDQLSIPA